MLHTIYSGIERCHDRQAVNQMLNPVEIKLEKLILDLTFQNMNFNKI